MRIWNRQSCLLFALIAVAMLIVPLGVSAKRAPLEPWPAQLSGIARTAPAVQPLEREGNLWRNGLTGAVQSAFHMNEGPFEGGAEAAARAFLESWSSQLKISSVGDLRTDEAVETPGGWHVRFTQTVGGVPVYRAEVVVSLDATGRWVRAVQNDFDPFVGAAVAGAPSLSRESAIGRAASTLGLPYDAGDPRLLRAALIDDPRGELMIVRAGDVPGGDARLAYRVTLSADVPAGDWAFRVDARSGEVFGVQDERVYVDGSGYTFDPDPLTTAEAVYGGVYGDNNDGDTAELNAERVMHTLPALTYNGGVYNLVGPYCQLADISAPSGAPATSPDPNGFAFTRSQQGFEDANVYFQIDNNQRYIQSLGFLAIQNGPITCDPHGANGADNSFFTPGSNRIAYGEGGVDDAEDADVILHEYGHGIQWSINHSWGGGQEGAMGEGFGDYWAGSYSANISTYREYWIFSWDGHNTFWAGRVLNTTKRYPQDLDGEVHDDGEIWSAPLFQSWHEVGRQVMDTVVLKSHYYLGSSATMVQGASAVMQADLDLFDGLHAGTLDYYFTRRGMFTDAMYIVPEVVHTPLTDTPDAGPYPITCTVTSSVALVPGSIKVVYGVDGAFDQESVLTATGNPNEYAGEIASQGSGVTINYYIKAKNQNGWQGTSPRGAAYTHHHFAVTGSSAVGEGADGNRLALGIHPNPTVPSGEIRFTLPVRADVVLAIFDPSGRMVRTLQAGELAAGAHTLAWDGRNDLGEPASPGVYFARLQAGRLSRVEKLVLTR
jgi:zinc metalloprotease ZmpB